MKFFVIVIFAIVFVYCSLPLVSAAAIDEPWIISIGNDYITVKSPSDLIDGRTGTIGAYRFPVELSVRGGLPIENCTVNVSSDGRVLSFYDVPDNKISELNNPNWLMTNIEVQVQFSNVGNYDLTFEMYCNYKDINMGLGPPPVAGYYIEIISPSEFSKIKMLKEQIEQEKATGRDWFILTILILLITSISSAWVAKRVGDKSTKELTKRLDKIANVINKRRKQ